MIPLTGTLWPVQPPLPLYTIPDFLYSPLKVAPWTADGTEEEATFTFALSLSSLSPLLGILSLSGNRSASGPAFLLSFGAPRSAHQLRGGTKVTTTAGPSTYLEVRNDKKYLSKIEFDF